MLRRLMRKLRVRRLAAKGLAAEMIPFPGVRSHRSAACA
jgi:hypothetical protein